MLLGMPDSTVTRVHTAVLDRAKAFTSEQGTSLPTYISEALHDRLERDGAPTTYEIVKVKTDYVKST